MAYTKEPMGLEEVVSVAAVVRKSTRFGPLMVSWRCMLVCGALGNGKATSIGACGVSSSAILAAMSEACCGSERLLMTGPRGKLEMVARRNLETTKLLYIHVAHLAHTTAHKQSGVTEGLPRLV